MQGVKNADNVDCIIATDSEVFGRKADRPSLLGMAFNSHRHNEKKELRRRAEVLKVDVMSKITAFVQDVSLVGVR